MKRILACLLVGLLVLSVLPGCSPTDEINPPPPGGEDSEKESSSQQTPSPSDPAAPSEEPEEQPEDAMSQATTQASYVNITAAEAKALMDGEATYVILDVREAYEFEEGHIPSAVLFPLDSINAASAAEILPDQNVMLLVYCRSGRRSKLASEALLQLGYTDIREFGGIIDWPYEIEP